jgi:hypothetical protein
MTAPEILSMVKDVVLACAGATTATVAIFGLKNWSRELRGRAEFDTARSLIRSMYRLRDEIQSSRSPFVSGHEFPEDYGSPGARTSEQEAQAWARVYSNRWNPVRDALVDFESHVLEAEALWGREVRERADDLRQCARNLQVAMEAVIDDKVQGGENFRSDKQFGKEMRSTVSASRHDKDNALTQKISDAITSIEAIARPHLKRS